EERLVVADGPAEHQPVLVAVKRGLLRREEVFCVQRSVAVELPSGAVKLIRAAIGGNHHLAAGLAPVFGGIRAGKDAEFVNRVQDRAVQRLVGGFVVVVDPVQDVLVGDFRISGDVESSAKAEVRTGGGREYVGRHQRELQVVAAVQGQLD